MLDVRARACVIAICVCACVSWYVCAFERKRELYYRRIDFRQ